ncbi:MAG: phosphoribosyltransferase [Planctomycetes bacterium]|nr:phosphoribosyltransferase [Planctomycetota bacterium]
MFRDREDAGQQLAERLLHLRDVNPLIFGLPRGGVVIAAQVAAALCAPLDVLVVRKLGAPGRPELALGAITVGDDPHLTLNQDLIDLISVSDEYLQMEMDTQREEVKRRNDRYRQGRPALSVEGRTTIIIDDGIATGATVLAGIMGLKDRKPGRLVLAVPVAASDSLEKLSQYVDEVVCLHAPDDFMSVGVFYSDFHQTTDDQVMELLERSQPAEKK